VNRILRNLFVAGCVGYSLLVMFDCRVIAAPPELNIEVYFSPRGGATEAILKEIGAARSSILVQAYSFTSEPIAEALAAAHRRGVRVEILLDQTKTVEEKRSKADFMTHSGVRVRVDARHGSAHNKVMILDDQTVITGSYNFTRHSEEDNAENLLIIRNKALAAKYAANWKSHAGHSSMYQGQPDRRTKGD
jgi:phosphatidylserine/phosphatidylglycerophosphate/cardiolipin synthase-like enzyme